MSVRACPVPQEALLQAYVARAGAYTDCFEQGQAGQVDLPAFITAFYTTWLFRLERAVLRLTLHHPITDAQVRALAAGQSDHFAAWRVEARGDSQILLCDLSGHTRSYLAVEPKAGDRTRLLFGSAVVADAQGDLPLWVRALMPLHRAYSVALLRCAARRLRVG